MLLDAGGDYGRGPAPDALPRDVACPAPAQVYLTFMLRQRKHPSPADVTPILCKATLRSLDNSDDDETEPRQEIWIRLYGT